MNRATTDSFRVVVATTLVTLVVMRFAPDLGVQTAAMWLLAGIWILWSVTALVAAAGTWRAYRRKERDLERAEWPLKER